MKKRFSQGHNKTMTEPLPTIGTTHPDPPATENLAISLVGRGLAAIKHKEIGSLVKQDALYRQARDIYNQKTDYGFIYRFKVELLPTADQIQKDPLLLQLQPFYDLIKQLSEIFYIFQQLADEGYGKAYFSLARMYWGGKGIKQNIGQSNYYSCLAFKWCYANKNEDDPEIWTDLGWMYQNGRGVDQDHKQAGYWYSKAAKQGDARAQSNLGRMYQHGQGVEQDENRALMCYFKAAEQGQAKAQYNLGWMFDSERDRSNIKGHCIAQDNERSLSWYRKAANQDHSQAQYRLGLMYAKGQGVKQNDKQAVSWYRKAAEQGDADAQYNLGWMYANGFGIEKDNHHAVFWYSEAAEQGHTDAQNILVKLGINWQES
ncbi:MAG: tetratricopeptide repeat protein [Methylococcales bacterium]|nr:tetratricopeptide repeat protein [Methylococcales bacterium]